ncbi:hypothetical protein EJ063_01175 [Vibrio aquaticus]|uniref:Uncharacterized protein n=1 Tax=Vibrio aquaticus TaxID=2496559 RepID=A0A3S0P850_9VIBR|nr:hypothetical protein [Vibrio aquaticus]RTZ17423.1 hypothetical protein EJ063_01175 [Vibrio aquaticus]
MNSIRKEVCLFTYTIFSLSLLFFSAFQLYQSIYRSAAELHVENLIYTVSKADEVNLTKALSVKLSSFPLPLAYDLSLGATLYEWVYYLSQDKRYLDLQFRLREQSVQLRPTWAPIYLQRAKLYRRLDNSKEKDMLDLALYFGPNALSSLIYNLDYTFSHWDNVSRESQVKAANQLLGVWSQFNYRSELNQMIEFSRGKQRICNLITFNNLSVESCKM